MNYFLLLGARRGEGGARFVLIMVDSRNDAVHERARKDYVLIRTEEDWIFANGSKRLFGRSDVSFRQGTNQPIISNVGYRRWICASYRIYDLEDRPGIGIGIQFDKSLQYPCDRVTRFEGQDPSKDRF